MGRKYEILTKCKLFYYPTALKSCQGIVFTHGVRMGGQAGGRAAGKSLSGLYLTNRKVLEVDTWWGHWLGGVGVQRHGLTLI